jgi:hypothetical protein
MSPLAFRAGALALFCSLSVPAGAAAISLSPAGPVVLSPGDVLTVEVRATGLFDGLASDDELLAFALDLSATPGVLSGFTLQSLYPKFDDNSALSGIAVDATAFPGLPNDPAHQDIVLATLSFQALTAGAFSIDISGNAAIPGYGLIFFYADAQDISASLSGTVKTAAAPLPGTIALLVPGLGLLGLARRRA